MLKSIDRRRKSLRRKPPDRDRHDRVLVVCEGSKTEPNYFNAIRKEMRLSSAAITVIHSEGGTQPLQVVESAITEFKKTKKFERVYAVFDRDDHASYHDAIKKAEAQRSKLKNDERKAITFEAIVSVPSFEVWLLMHFQEVTAWIDRHVAVRHLTGHIPNYVKGMKDVHERTRGNIEYATRRAIQSRGQNGRLPGDAIYTDVDVLVATLHGLTKK